MCHVNATLKCVLLFETWFVVIASSSSFSQLLFLGCQPGCYRLLNLFTLEITNLKRGKPKVVSNKYSIHIPYKLQSHNILYSLQTLGLIDTDDSTGSFTFQNWCYSNCAETLLRGNLTNQQPCLSAQFHGRILYKTSILKS